MVLSLSDNNTAQYGSWFKDSIGGKRQKQIQCFYSLYLFLYHLSLVKLNHFHHSNFSFFSTSENSDMESFYLIGWLKVQNVEDRNLNIESEFFFYSSLYDSQALTFFLLFWCFKGPSKSVPGHRNTV